MTPKTVRANYFSISSKVGNLFLDPDTGVRLLAKGGVKSVNYVFASELVEWSQARPNALTLVFDQCYARGKQSEQMQEKIRFFDSHGVHCFAYSSHAPILFLSASEKLADGARTRLIKVTGLPEWRFVVLENRRIC